MTGAVPLVVVVLVLAVLPVCVPQPASPNASLSLPPSHCCTPSQWSGQLRAVISEVEGGNVSLTEFAMEVQYDEPMQRIAAAGVMKKGKAPLDIKIVRNYTEGQSYFIMKPGCFRIPIEKTFQKACVPEMAQPQEVMYYGDVSGPQHSLWVQSWLQSGGGVARLSTSLSSCALVTYTSFSQPEFGAVSAELVNQTEVVNPDFFRHPADCPPAQAEPAWSRILDIALLRHSH